MAGGPPRVTWHITYDSLRSDGSPAIGFSAVTNYLNDKGYQVHLVWDPVTGDIIQLLPANVGGAGLVHSGPPQTNNMGEVNIQIEAYFTPGVVRNGVRYDQLTDTPMAGLDRIMSLADSWGIPHVAPLAPGNRNASVWVNQAGHYGHFNVPENDHSDPVVPIQAILDRAGSAPAPGPAAPKEDEMFSKSTGPTAHIIASHSGLTVEGAGDGHQGMAVVQSVADGGLDQRWEIVYHVNEQPAGQFSLRARTGLCLDVPDNDGKPGKGLRMWAANWSAAQRFQLDPVNPFLSFIKHTASGLYLDISGGEAGLTAGRPLILWNKNGGRNQQFVFAPTV